MYFLVQAASKAQPTTYLLVLFAGCCWDFQQFILSRCHIQRAINLRTGGVEFFLHSGEETVAENDTETQFRLVIVTSC